MPLGYDLLVFKYLLLAGLGVWFEGSIQFCDELWIRIGREQSGLPISRRLFKYNCIEYFIILG